MNKFIITGTIIICIIIIYTWIRICIDESKERRRKGIIEAERINSKLKREGKYDELNPYIYCKRCNTYHFKVEECYFPTPNYGGDGEPH